MAKPLAEHKGVVKSRKKRDEEPAGGSRWPFRRGGPNEEAAAQAGFDMEYVPGGSVRRITFEEEPPEPATEPERPARSWVPRHKADVRHIEAEVDRIGKASGGAGATAARSQSQSSTRTTTSERRLETSRSSLDERRQGERRTSYTSSSKSRITDTGRHFTPAQVDRVLADRYRDPEFRAVAPRAAPPAARAPASDLDETIGKRVREVRRTRTLTRQVGDQPPEVISSETTVEGWTPEAAPGEDLETFAKTTKTRRITKKTVAKPAAKAVSKAAPQAAPKAAPKVSKPAPEAPKAASKATVKPATEAKETATKAAAEASKDADEKEYQPQCAGLTQAGVQCRNSARARSKYCASHKGYRPPSASSLTQLDTAPRVKGAADTTPQLQEISSKAKETGEGDLQPQCAALTAEGVQCRNSSRTTSKYCASHKGYRAKSAAALKSIDTAPRHKGAEDTKPALRKAANKSKKDTSG